MGPRSMRNRFLVLGLVLLGLAAPPAAATGTLALDGWRSKVDPRVLAAAEAGPTEFFVYLKEKADVSAADALPTKEQKGRLVYDRLREVAASSQAPLLAQLELLGVEHRSFWIVNTILVRGDLSVLQAMAQNPAVASVFGVGRGGLDTPVPGDADGVAAPTVVTAGVEPGVSRVGAPQAWSLGFRGQGVVVASADTGVQWDHPALKGKYVGWDAATQTVSHDYAWHDGNRGAPTCPNVATSPCDDNSHGTHTVGTMVGDDGAANQIGMAPEARWIACKNMTEGFGVVPTYLDCMEWILAPTRIDGTGADPTKAPDIVNNSWGCVEVCAPPLLKEPIDRSRAAGIVYVVSAGNDHVVAGCSEIAFPLSVYRSAFTVGATNTVNDTIASFSSRGPVVDNPIEGVAYRKPDISAPGVGTRSSVPNNTYGSKSGTSMAGPHVVGVVALILSARPDLAGDVDAVETIVESTAVPRPPGSQTVQCGGDTPTSVPNNIYGFGRVDALKAVQAALAFGVPVAADDFAETDEEVAVSIDVLANDADPDGDPVAIAGAGPAANGTVTVSGDAIEYAPALDFAGTDSFSYTIEDPDGNTASATVTVTVNDCPDVDDSHESVAYRTGWDTRSDPGATGGSYHRRGGSSQESQRGTVELRFTGTGVTYHYAMSEMGGAANVYIDDVLVDTVSYGDNRRGAESVTFGHVRAYGGLDDGEHVLRIERLFGVVYVDGFGFSCEGGPA
ncbi:MAG: S8 family serine peptidase [Actinobacteria bacterium]|nr:S8 family serine peptidase [Actinomycetota bacterium]